MKIWNFGIKYFGHVKIGNQYHYACGDNHLEVISKLFGMSYKS